MATTSKELLDASEAAKLLSVLPARLKRWAKAGLVPCVLLPDGEARFVRADLNAWIAAHRKGGRRDG